MAAARMIGVAVRHRGALDGARRIDPQVGGLHVNAARMRVDPGPGPRHQAASFRARTRSATNAFRSSAARSRSGIRSRKDGWIVAISLLPPSRSCAAPRIALMLTRPEERRVGKECV